MKHSFTSFFHRNTFCSKFPGLALLILLAFLKPDAASAQQPGDTIVVKAFKYGSSTRDTLLQFPSGNLTFEKIILKYNMRCKNALISNQTNPNQGCGEWDYSCNTFVVDSTRIENETNSRAKYTISNFSGNTFSYTSLPIYDYYNFSQINVNLSSVTSETQHVLSNGSTAVNNLLKGNEKSGRSQILYTATELIAAGFTPGNIDGFLLSVANAGGAINFFKVGIQSTTLTALNANTLTLAGFTNVFNANYTFTTGTNRIQFHTPFVWNGTSNVLIDLAFTNTGGGNAVVLNGVNTPSIMSLYSSNNYALDLSAFGHVNLNPSVLNSISNELTVSFWAYGTASLMPVNTSILYGYGTNPNQRNLNIHLPWSNGSIYFDCGFSAGNFDRINNVATANEQGGQWNHWTFTKNATTGAMKIYRNGTQWASGTGLTKPISLLNLILGKDKDLLNNYKGKVNELTIWNKELSQSDIQNWMNRSIDATHPFYSNLQAYYKLNEGNGLTITDSKNNLTSTGVNLQWTYDRGTQLNRMFSESIVRPRLVLVRGTYVMNTSTVTVKDSLRRNPNVVETYSVISNATVVPMAHDVVTLVATSNLYQSSPIQIYNGDTGLLTGTLAVNTQSTLALTNLTYYNRYPYYNELLSFVTPYGKGLDLGQKGKTWYYDITDFTPLLKGPKRFLMAMGGENQEQMDIDFWFIVGTPPRNVVEYKQLWQGAARLSGSSITSINNDVRFPVLTETMAANAQAFKMRSTITGHGSQGEFGQNGGVVNHYFNIAGGPNEFTWQITQECSTNPIMAQGGTWVYDRQGWCPGQTSLTKEYDITPHVTPGGTVTLDYNCSPPTVANGDYRYLVAHQLVSYGAANHSNDAAVLDVLAPSTKVLYSKSNPMCMSPLILVRNTGSTAVTEMDFEYWLNSSNVKETYHWNCNLNFMDTAYVTLPIGNLWQNGLQPSNNKFHVEIKKANAAVDQYSLNNLYHSDFTLPDVLNTNSITIEFKTNNNPYENTYKLIDETGTVILGASSLVAANTIYSDNYFLTGCYKLIVEDLGGDGLQWWANTAQGAGTVKIRDGNGLVLKNFATDFGNGFEYSFSTIPNNYVSLTENALAREIRVFPNPAHHLCQISGHRLLSSSLVLTDVLGRVMPLITTGNDELLTIDTSSLLPGVYLLNIAKDGQRTTKKLVIQ